MRSKNLSKLIFCKAACDTPIARLTVCVLVKDIGRRLPLDLLIQLVKCLAVRYTRLDEDSRYHQLIFQARGFRLPAIGGFLPMRKIEEFSILMCVLLLRNHKLISVVQITGTAVSTPYTQKSSEESRSLPGERLVADSLALLLLFRRLYIV